MGWLAVELTEIVWAFTDATNPSIAPVKSDHPVLIIDNSQSELRARNDKQNAKEHGGDIRRFICVFSCKVDRRFSPKFTRVAAI